MVAWFIRRSGSWVLEACPGENSLPLPFCAYQYCFLMLTLFILYLPFFPHMRLLWTLVWKWSIFLMVMAHLWLWVHFHPLLCSMSVVWLHPWASLPSGFWLCCSSGSTEDLEWGDGSFQQLPPCQVTVAGLFPLPAASPVWKSSSCVLLSSWRVLILHQVPAPWHFKVPGSLPFIGCFS